MKAQHFYQIHRRNPSSGKWELDVEMTNADAREAKRRFKRRLAQAISPKDARHYRLMRLTLTPSLTVIQKG